MSRRTIGDAFYEALEEEGKLQAATDLLFQIAIDPTKVPKASSVYVSTDLILHVRALCVQIGVDWKPAHARLVKLRREAAELEAERRRKLREAENVAREGVKS